MRYINFNTLLALNSISATEKNYGIDGICEDKKTSRNREVSLPLS